MQSSVQHSTMHSRLGHLRQLRRDRDGPGLDDALQCRYSTYGIWYNVYGIRYMVYRILTFKRTPRILEHMVPCGTHVTPAGAAPKRDSVGNPHLTNGSPHAQRWAGRTRVGEAEAAPCPERPHLALGHVAVQPNGFWQEFPGIDGGARWRNFTGSAPPRTASDGRTAFVRVQRDGPAVA